MKWHVLTPFLQTRDQTWLTDKVQGHQFNIIPAGYQHDRLRARASRHDWLDYFGHTARGWREMERHDGMITSFPQLAGTCGLLKKVTRHAGPVVAWNFNLGALYEGMQQRAGRFMLSAVDVFVVHSRHECRTYSQWLRLPESRFEFVPFGIGVAQSWLPEEREQPFVLAMGTANRDWGTFFAAVERLGYRTVVVAPLRNLEGLRIPPQVEVLTQLSLRQCHELCQRATVNVVPIENVQTASGQVTLVEAMMFGRATVATRCPGTEDMATDGVQTLLVPAADPQAMADAIEALWSDEALRQRIGRAALEHTWTELSEAAESRRMQQILDRLDPSRP